VVEYEVLLQGLVVQRAAQHCYAAAQHCYAAVQHLCCTVCFIPNNHHIKLQGEEERRRGIAARQRYQRSICVGGAQQAPGHSIGNSTLTSGSAQGLTHHNTSVGHLGHLP